MRGEPGASVPPGLGTGADGPILQGRFIGGTGGVQWVGLALGTLSRLLRGARLC